MPAIHDLFEQLHTALVAVIDCLVNTADELKNALFGITAVNDKGQAQLLTQLNEWLKRVFLPLTFKSVTP